MAYYNMELFVAVYLTRMLTALPDHFDYNLAKLCLPVLVVTRPKDLLFAELVVVLVRLGLSNSILAGAVAEP